MRICESACVCSLERKQPVQLPMRAASSTQLHKPYPKMARGELQLCLFKIETSFTSNRQITRR